MSENSGERMKHETEQSISEGAPVDSDQRCCPECGRTDAKAGAIWNCYMCFRRFTDVSRWWDLNCICAEGGPGNYDGPAFSCPVHGIVTTTGTRR